MKIKVAKNYILDQIIYESDKDYYRDHMYSLYPEKTYKSDYISTWDEEDVTIEQLQYYIKEGYAIKINC